MLYVFWVFLHAPSGLSSKTAIITHHEGAAKAGVGLELC